ncbi:N/A [soil metagenome]
MRRFLLALAVLVAVAPVAPVAHAQVVGEDDGAETDPDAGVAAPRSPPAPSGSVHTAIRPRVKLPEKDGMLLVPAGRFTMGSSDAAAPPNEKPTHPESVAAFWIDKTEITVGAYRVCVGAKKCAPPQRSSPLCTWTMGEDALPVSCVRYSDADQYCRYVGKRLLREAEWEYAARGMRPIRYPWGGSFSSCAAAATLINDATARACTGRAPSHVGVHAMGVSPFGVFDMTGNVEEWTADWYVEHVAPGAQPHSGASHVLRGGGWLSPPGLSKTTSRNWGSSVEAGPNVGFRCGRSESERAAK